MVDQEDPVLRALNALEDLDARYLVWGLIDETWTEDKVRQVIEAALPDHDPQFLIDRLLEAHHLVEVPAAWPVRYRTRMAESVRLFALLRQLFPKRPWRFAPRLVADFRFRHEARRFADRNLSADDMVARLAGQGLSGAQTQAAKQVLRERTLSGFQLESACAVFEALTGRDRGVVVSAGTGSGKTLAFYLPALSHLAASTPTSEGVGALAIYPRNELLKDQFGTALDEVRQLRAEGGRALRIAALFNPTPFDCGEPQERDGWRKVPSGWVCPFLSCRVRATPGSEYCGGSMMWLDRDRREKTERLICMRCRDVVQDEVVLTRRSIQKRPPDLLFATTEMLNRGLCDGYSMHLFGVGPRAKRKPAFVLLDEIHTYEGTSGAQVAYVLRRWRYLMGKPTTWVGLSATLANATSFLADLCGIDEAAVREIRPHEDDLRPRGREYQLVLRGDPASQAALLSTTIQTLMLLRRILNPVVGGEYGSKAFAFCDNLDLVNRLYRQLLNAEGLTPFGRLDPRGRQLAGLRFPSQTQRDGPVTDWPARDADGQYWWLPEHLGFADRMLSIGRTSSQDTGVQNDADIVVATASLEVGFDDPAVGAVLQHKAPRDVAQFLQRRGRAGRTQLQRPWTVVVLSDYGRDRSAYQDYETMLDPALPAKTLPMGNQSVRKMQAAMSLIDWCARRLDVTTPKRRATMRKIFSVPSPDPNGVHEELRQATTELLTAVMEGGPDRDDLIKFVAASLRLDADEVQSIGWEQPRALLLDTVPTALRRLSSNWGQYSEGQIHEKQDSWTNDRPLPDFIPSSLFADLCLPEVRIEAPDGYDQAANDSLPIAMALHELAPGKVTLRWAVQKIKGLWISPPADQTPLALEQGFAAHAEVLGQVHGQQGSLPLVRPLIMRPEIPPSDVLSTSNGRLRWQFYAEPTGAGTELIRPRSGPLTDRIIGVTAYLHTDGGALRTWRYAATAGYDLARKSGRTRSTCQFSWRGEPAAVGYEALVDAVRVTVKVPTTLDEFHLTRSARRLRQLRKDWFAHRLQTALHELGYDPFLARWLYETVASLIAMNISTYGDFTAFLTASADIWTEAAGEVVKGVLLSSDEQFEEEQPLSESIMDALREPAVLTAIVEVLPLLVADPDHVWLPWLRQRYLYTVAAAWQAAAQQLCPDFDVEDDCVVDLEDDGSEAAFVMSDASVGGGGLVETLVSRISDDPRRFDFLILAALEPSDLEEVDSSLRRTLLLVEGEAEVAEGAHAYRTSEVDRLDRWKDLVNVLVSHGVSAAHATFSALSNRVFRKHSSAKSDALLRLCLQRWDELNQLAGFALDHRTACAVLANDFKIRDALAEAAPEGNSGRSWVQSVLLGLLWTSSESRRATALVTSNRFIENVPMSERTLVLDTIGEPINTVDVDEPDWLSRLASLIRHHGRCRLVSASNNRQRLKAALQTLATQPIELGWLHVHTHVEAITRQESAIGIEVSLEEVAQ